MQKKGWAKHLGEYCSNSNPGNAPLCIILMQQVYQTRVFTLTDSLHNQIQKASDASWRQPSNLTNFGKHMFFHKGNCKFKIWVFKFKIHPVPIHN